MNASGEEHSAIGRPLEGMTLEFGAFSYDTEHRLLLQDGSPVALPLRICKLLEYFLTHAGEVTEKRDLLENVWREALVGEDSLSKAVSLLRSALEDDPHDPAYIQTVPRRGYRFIATLAAVDHGSPSDESDAASRQAGRGLPVGNDAEFAVSGPAREPRATPERRPNRRPPARWRRVLAWSVSSAIALLVGYYLGTADGTTVRIGSSAKWHLPLSNRVSFEQQPGVAVAPDGSKIVFTTTHGNSNLLYVRAIDSLEAEPLLGTDGATYPFFSPDSNWVGFFTPGDLKKVSLETGAVLGVCAVGMGFGGSWGPDGTILFSAGGSAGLLSVPEAGGPPQTLLADLEPPVAGVSMRFPQILENGSTVLFSFGSPTDRSHWSIGIADLSARSVTTVLRGSRFARYSPSGHLVYAIDGHLLAAKFDLDSPEQLGKTVVVSRDALTWAGGPIQTFDMSKNGLLAHVAGTSTSGELELVWVDFRGRQEPLGLGRKNYAHPRVSPDGGRLAVTVSDDLTNVWISDLTRQTISPLSVGAGGILPVWMTDQDSVAFASPTTLGWQILLKHVQSERPPEVLVESRSLLAPSSSTRDGAILAYAALSPETGFDIWILDRELGTRQPFLEGPPNENAPVISPDGRFLAYVSDETGAPEVFVVSYPDPALKRMASTNGGTQPMWHPNGSRLFYRHDDRVMEVDVSVRALGISLPRELFRFPKSTGVWPQIANYDVAEDGQRFLMLRPAEPRNETDDLSLVVETNWGWLEPAPTAIGDSAGR